jgi:hypothetical protein
MLSSGAAFFLVQWHLNWTCAPPLALEVPYSQQGNVRTVERQPPQRGEETVLHTFPLAQEREVLSEHTNGEEGALSC